MVCAESGSGESQANGLAERAVKDAKGVVRSAVEQLHGNRRTAFELRTSQEVSVLRREGDTLERRRVCVQDRSDEVVIGTRDGVVSVRTAKRLDGLHDIDAESAREIGGRPWEQVPGDLADESAVQVASVLIGHAMRAQEPAVVPERELGARILYVKTR